MYSGLVQVPPLVGAWAEYLKRSGHEVRTLEYERSGLEEHSPFIYLEAKSERSDFVGVVLSDMEAKDLKKFVVTLSKLKGEIANRNVELHVMVPDYEFDQVNQVKALARDVPVHIDAIWEFKTSSVVNSSTDSRSS